jgi:hypothetical protein
VRAASDEPDVRRSGVATLRWFGDEELMLRECYGLSQRRDFDLDAAHWLGSGGKRISPDEAREIFFRVTGKPFNAVPPPKIMTRVGGLSPMENEFSWDDALGGETVAGRVKGLSLLSSRLDAVAEPDAANVYCEWTMEFVNVASQPREARAQIGLPPGAVVSRVTLWVNGEEREAAFGGRAQVRAAYQQAAVVQRRDPLLVTTCGPDRVLVQCFPVPANGSMKIRIGVTAPLAQLTPGGGKFFWPKFLERNFKLAPEFKHAVWLQSPAALTAVDSDLTPSRADSGNSLRGNLPDGATGSVFVARDRQVVAVWTPSIDAGQIVRQRFGEKSSAPFAKIFFVVDGSVGMRQSVSQIARLVGELPAGVEPVVILAGDEPARLDSPSGQSGAALVYELRRRIGEFSFVGGRDNLPALELAWELASASDRAAIVWLHDTQPVRLSSADSLRQRLEHNARHLVIRDVQLRPGPNRIAEQLDGLNGFQVAATDVDLRDTIYWLKTTGQTNVEFFLQRERVVANVENQVGTSASRHVERLWARDETTRLAHSDSPAAAAQFAAHQQIVTPWSGAVVLETKAQYDQHGLTPAEFKTVPPLPEPATWALFAVGLAALALLRRQRVRG